MRSHFGFSYKEGILFESWKTNNVGEFIGSWIAILLFSIFYEFIKSLRTILEIRWSKNNSSNGIDIQSSKNIDEEKNYISSSFLDGYYPQFTKKDIIRGFLHGLEMTMSLVLMLIIMGFNIALFFAVIIGVIIGYIIFGRFRQYKPKTSC
ncbi:hypothetical protein DICPUDRAFT_148307 [Dictyostelium purpureum]|uniref:Copper transport protein n=1 Tax=Dictyostelium purpureum TaxID=5786 RepID=F0ZAS4_DICPU|nr:uncharacterized protein DICPUDRAFT_148307 [Dictyostelium purpureum]EGC38973.1 hypothetical protein DICPUDRAFT_148307 [Dictyostelium purpureum]|eukprot:XP_003284538.1 hypothetical protein DICPUDRAFT_148307 [Dictyostelium purpureum]